MKVNARTFQDPLTGEVYSARPMTLHDVAQVAELEQQLFASPWSAQSFESELEDREHSLALVLVNGQHIIAYMIVYLIYEQAHLANIAVAPAYQQRGLGRWLLHILITEARAFGSEVIHLEVRPSNEKALRLYSSLDFIQVGVRKRYYEDGEEAWLMSKRL